MQIFCTYCSASKSTAPGQIAAILRYQSGRIERIYRAARQVGLSLFILSGEFGLVPAEQPIPWYDHLLAPGEVPAKAELVLGQIRRLAIAGVVYFTQPLAQEPAVSPYHDVLVAACCQAPIPYLVIDLGPSEQLLDERLQL